MSSIGDFLRQHQPQEPTVSQGKSLRVFSATFAVAFIVLAVLLVVARPTSISTGPDEQGLHYSGGAFTPTRFKNCVAASTRQWDGPGDKHYSYPSSQTNYVFSDEPGADSAPFTFVTQDGIEMTVDGVANFLLNTDCDALRGFHDLIGNRYQAYLNDDGTRPEGWSTKVLPIYIGKPLDTAIDRAGQNYTYAKLYRDPATKTSWENDVLELLPDLVNRQTDGDVAFFENFALTLQKPEPPAAIKEALVKEQADVAQARAQEAKAKADEATARAQVRVQKQEAQKIEAIIKVLGVDGYLKQVAIQNGLNPFQPSTQGVITGPGQ